MKRRKKWLDYTVYLIVRTIAAALAVFPIDVVLSVMRGLGRLWFWLPQALPESHVPDWIAPFGFRRWLVKLSAQSNKLLSRFREHRNRAEQHIRGAFPELDERSVSRLARASMEQLTMLTVEVLLSPRLVTKWTWARHLKLGKLDEAIRVLLERRGCIMLTGHYGNWELLGFGLATLGFEIVAVMRPLDNEYLNAYLLDRRERSGLRLLYKKGATQSAPDVLESGGSLCFIADQNAGSKGLFVDFFGRKASTYKSIGLLAMAYNVPVVVGCARRIGRGFQYEMSVNRVIRPEEWKAQPDELRWITQEFTRAIEDFVRVDPSQYLWIHRRWKSRPKEELAAAAASKAPEAPVDLDPAEVAAPRYDAE
jgi:Kdo2-lipid IVA lauroyltransferase/acyltransferase